MKKIPLRTCMGCNEKKPKKELIRIVRNKDGVFVMTPQLNQIFKFQGSWPNNTQKPYLIQTIDKLLKDANITKDKKERGKRN